MKKHKDIFILKKDKEQFRKTKEKTAITYSKQLESVFNYFDSMPIDNFIEIIVNNYSEYKSDELTTLTVNKSYFKNENFYDSICKAIQSKIPDLDLKKMYVIMIHYYLSKQTKK